VVYDLGRGGGEQAWPDAELGAAAYDAAVGTGGADAAQGCVGAGTGTTVGGLKGGVGTASAVLPGGATVGALAVVNAAGSAVDLRTGELLGARHLLVDEVPGLRRPDPGDLAAAIEAAAQTGDLGRPLATTLVVLATDLTLTKAQCQKVAGIGHDGLARALDPVHTMVDGDTVFTLATGELAAPDFAAFHGLLTAAGTSVTRAVVHAVLSATSVDTPAGRLRSYREAFPSAFPAAFPAN
jgi:putative pantetheine hydrolase